MKSLIFCCLAIATVGIAAEPLRPNILYFYVDDMGWGSIGPNGQDERRRQGLASVKTPNIDQLAAEGINFTRAYGCTVCSPARSSQQTGYHQGHTFADRNDPDNAKKAIRKDDITMGDVLSKAGYATGYWGKWGYGGSKDMENPVIDNVQTLPTSHGYQHVLAELHHVRAHTFFQPTLWSAPPKGNPKGGLELVPNTMLKYLGDASFPAQPSNHADPKYPTIAYCDDAYAFAALEFVRKQAKNYNAKKKPFFGIFAAQIPHGPFDEVAKLPGWDAAYVDDPHFSKLSPQSQQWAAMVTRIDAHFGNILAALDDPNGDSNSDDSVSENTLVIFMSDNGGPGGKNNSEYDANGGLRGNKGSIFEGGIRVPTVMRWPGKIAAGTGSDLPIDVTDLLPTFCELAGSKIPLGIDGVSLAPILTGEGERRKRHFLIHEAGKSQSIIQENHKLIRSAKKLALYDLKADPGEKNDIARENKKLVNELEALLLGERVAEPRGFANTYHRWESSASSPLSLSDPDNWSDYVYQNEGITYMEDSGAPDSSWTASLDYRSKSPGKIIADKDAEFLGLEISGIPSVELFLKPKVNLTGRNEIRVSQDATLTVNGGTVSSLRWIEVSDDGIIQGNGKIEGAVYNAGTVSLADSGFELEGDFYALPGAKFQVENSGAILKISENAQLSGILKISDEFRSLEDTSIIVAHEITGIFTNSDNLVKSPDGRLFKIKYGKGSVSLVPVENSEIPKT